LEEIVVRLKIERILLTNLTHKAEDKMQIF